MSSEECSSTSVTFLSDHENQQPPLNLSDRGLISALLLITLRLLVHWLLLLQQSSVTRPLHLCYRKYLCSKLWSHFLSDISMCHWAWPQVPLLSFLSSWCFISHLYGRIKASTNPDEVWRHLPRRLRMLAVTVTSTWAENAKRLLLTLPRCRHQNTNSTVYGWRLGAVRCHH